MPVSGTTRSTPPRPASACWRRDSTPCCGARCRRPSAAPWPEPVPTPAPRHGSRARGAGGKVDGPFRRSPPMRHPNPVLPRAGLLALPLAACQQPAPEPPAEPPAPEQPAQPGQPAMEPVEAPPAEAMGATGGTDPAAGPDAEALGGPVPTAPDESGAAFEDTRPGC